MTDSSNTDHPNTGQPAAGQPAAGTTPPPADPAPKKRKTLWIVVSAVGAAIIALVVSLVVSALLNNMGGPNKQALIEKNVEVAKQQFDLPYQVDEVTVLEDITAEQDAIRYDYTLVGVDPSLLSEQALSDVVLPGLCSTSETRELLDQGVTMKYSYVLDETGDTYDLAFTKDDC